MKLFKSTEHKWNEDQLALLATATRRVAKLTSAQLIMWSDGAASEIMKALEDFMRTENQAALDEMTYAVITLQAVVKELTERHVLTREV